MCKSLRGLLRLGTVSFKGRDVAFTSVLSSFLPTPNKSGFQSYPSLRLSNRRCHILTSEFDSWIDPRVRRREWKHFGRCAALRQLNKAGSEWGTCCIGGVFSFPPLAGLSHRNRPSVDNMLTACVYPADRAHLWKCSMKTRSNRLLVDLWRRLFILSAFHRMTHI